jgi:hypothetical protein
MNQIPPNVRSELLTLVSELADEHNYLGRTRPENHQFMVNLMENPKIGLRIAEFLGANKIKTYIKDSLLHYYAMQRRRPKQSAAKYLASLGLTDFNQIDTPNGKPSLFRLNNGNIFAVSFTSYRKWETGVRNLLIFVAGRERLRKSTLRFGLIIYDPKLHICDVDKQVVINALKLVKIETIWDTL